MGATSSGVPHRAIGTLASSESASSGMSCMTRVIPVRMSPGATALTRIPSAAHMRPSCRVIWITPAFAAP